MSASGKGWRLAGVDEMTPMGDAAEPGFWSQWAREPDFGKGWGSIGPFFGIRGFGVATSHADAGDELVVPHEEVSFDGQEELYVGLSGRARFTLDGESVELGPGDLLHVEASVMREAVAMESATRILCIGGTPGRAYGEAD
jgi:uncharacterized cupin superfamily protein